MAHTLLQTVLCALGFALGGGLIGWGWRGLRADQDLDALETQRRADLEASRRRHAELEGALDGQRGRIAQLEPLSMRLQDRDLQLTESRAQASALEAELRKIHDTHASETAALRAGHDGRSREIGERLTAADTQLALIPSLQAQVRERDLELEDLRRQVGELYPLNATLRERDLRIAQTTARVAALEAELAQQRSAHAVEFAAVRSDAETRVQSFAGRLSEAGSQIAELAPVRQQLREREARLAEANARIAGLDIEQRKLHDAHAAELDSFRRRVAEVDSLRRQVEDSAQRLQLASERIGEIEAESDALHDRDTEEAETLRARIVELEALIPAVRERDNRLAQAEQRIALLEPLRSAVDERSAQLGQAAARAAALSERAVTLEGESRRLRDQHAAEIAALRRESETRAANFASRISEAEKRVSEAAQRAATLDTESRGLRTRVAELEAREPEVVERVVEKIVERVVEVPAPAAAEASAPLPPTEPLPRKRPAKPRTRPKDDLELINGVGPMLAKLLNRRGVTQFRQVARWDAKDIASFEAAMPNFKGRVRREGWIRSARAEHIKKYRRDP